MTIVHLSDIHVWHFTRNIRDWYGKRAVGLLELLLGRARRFPRERLADVVERVRSLRPDHVLITGDLTTTSLPVEFENARRALEPLLADRDPDRVTILPGNHDRYTTKAVRERWFERYFGEFQPQPEFPWLRWLDEQTAILGLDPTRAHLTARGRLRRDQLERAGRLLEAAQVRPARLIVACHYPVAAPPRYRRELARKSLVGARELKDWLATIGQHVYCCGHVHAAWAFTPPESAHQLALNAGSPLFRHRDPARRPGFLEVRLDGPGVTVVHHGWTGREWSLAELASRPDFFDRAVVPRPAGH